MLIEDLSEKTFNRWTVFGRSRKDNKGNYYWECVCVCGAKKIIAGYSLKSGRSKSCGCLIKDYKFTDLTGKIFDKLTVIEKIEKSKRLSWICRCKCGKEIIVLDYNLKNSHTKSCGCLLSEKLLERNKKYVGKNSPSYKHGLYGTKEYHNYHSSKRRSRKLKATTCTSDERLIELYYKVCQSLEGYEVDHFQPLSKGGLHHQDNLQILLRELNREKSNKWPLTEEEKIKYVGFKLGGNMIVQALNYNEFYYNQLLASLASIRINSPEDSVLIHLLDFPRYEVLKLEVAFPFYTFVVKNGLLRGVKDIAGFMVCYRTKAIKQAMKDYKCSIAWFDTDTLIRKPLTEFWGDVTADSLKISCRDTDDILVKFQAGVFAVGYCDLTYSMISDWSLCVKEDTRWFADQEYLYRVYDEYRPHILLIPMDLKFNDIGDSTRDNVFDGESVIWHCKSKHFNHPRFSKEFKYYFNKALEFMNG